MEDGNKEDGKEEKATKEVGSRKDGSRKEAKAKEEAEKAKEVGATKVEKEAGCTRSTYGEASPPEEAGMDGTTTAATVSIRSTETLDVSR